MLESTDGVRIALHELGGDPDAAPLLICHATGFLAAAYRPLAERLVSRRRIVGVDVRGHGDSIRPDSVDMNWWGMVADVRTAIEHLGVDGIDTVGHAMGGAALIGASLTGAPITSIWAFEPIVFPPPEPGQKRPSEMPENARRRRPEFDSFDAAFERYSSRPPLSIFHPEVLRAYVDHGFRATPHGTVRLKCEPEIEAQVFENADIGLHGRLGDVTARVHVEAGVLEPGPPAIAPGVAEGIEGATFHRDESITHFGPFQAPDQIAARIDAWLAMT